MVTATHRTKPKAIREDHLKVLKHPQPLHHIPFSQEAEEATLGAMLLDPGVTPIIMRILVAEDFFLVRHSYIYRALENLYTEDETFDYVTVGDYLRNKGVLDEIGGRAMLTYLVNNTPTSTHAEVYANLVANASTRRRILLATDEIRALALDEAASLGDQIPQAERLLSESTIDYAKRREEFWSDIVDAELDKHINPHKYINDSYQLEFPVKDVRFKLQAEEVTLLAGLTGTGKTAFALWLLLHYLLIGKTVVFVSLEMSKRKIMYRLLAQMTGINAEDLEVRRYPSHKAKEVQHAFKALRDFEGRLIVVESAETEKAINRAVGAIAYRQDIHLVIIDHLFIVHTEKYHNKAHERLKAVAQEFQAQAKQYVCPYLVLHQLKEPPPHRTDKSPYTSDIHGNTTLENVPDNIYAIHRDDHSKLGIADAVKGRVDLYQLKDRNGGDNTRKLTGHLRYIGNERYRAWEKTAHEPA